MILCSADRSKKSAHFLLGGVIRGGMGSLLKLAAHPGMVAPGKQIAVEEAGSLLNLAAHPGMVYNQKIWGDCPGKKRPGG
jgi:hypothetical protein